MAQHEGGKQWSRILMRGRDRRRDNAFQIWLHCCQEWIYNTANLGSHISFVLPAVSVMTVSNIHTGSGWLLSDGFKNSWKMILQEYGFITETSGSKKLTWATSAYAAFFQRCVSASQRKDYVWTGIWADVLGSTLWQFPSPSKMSGKLLGNLSSKILNIGILKMCMCKYISCMFS